MAAPSTQFPRPEPPYYDSCVYAYNADGTVATVKYYIGGTSGTLCGTSTFTYNAAGQLTSSVLTAP